LSTSSSSAASRPVDPRRLMSSTRKLLSARSDSVRDRLDDPLDAARADVRLGFLPAARHDDGPVRDRRLLQVGEPIGAGERRLSEQARDVRLRRQEHRRLDRRERQAAGVAHARIVGHGEVFAAPRLGEPANAIREPGRELVTELSVRCGRKVDGPTGTGMDAGDCPEAGDRGLEVALVTQGLRVVERVLNPPPFVVGQVTSFSVGLGEDCPSRRQQSIKFSLFGLHECVLQSGSS
jgi:hypothetical protein